MISQIFDWAWVNGLNVRLESKSYEVPVYGEHRFTPRREAPNYVNHDRMAIDMPVLTLSRGDRHISLEATNWANMMAMLEHQHERIFAQLSCVPMPKRKKK